MEKCIEFAEWIGRNGYHWDKAVGKYSRWETEWQVLKCGGKVRGLCHYSTKELHEKFMFEKIQNKS